MVAQRFRTGEGYRETVPALIPIVGRRNATRGGLNGSLRKLSQSKTSAQDPKAHPNPRVLGVVQNSYRRATRTLKTLGTSEIEHESKHTKSARKRHGILSPVETTYTT